MNAFHFDPAGQASRDNVSAPEDLVFNASAGSVAPVAILSTPKTGNLWIRYCLERGLHLYGRDVENERELTPLLDAYTSEAPKRPFIFHAHLEYTRQRAHALAATGAQIVTLLRHPIDTLLSLRRHHRRLGTRVWPDELLCSDSTTEEFVRDIFPALLAISASWARNGAAIVRYEDMLSSPKETLQRLLDRCSPAQNNSGTVAFMSRIASINLVRESSSPADQNHFAVGRSDQWRWDDNRDILEMFRRSPALMQTIEEWGYSADVASLLDAHDTSTHVNLDDHDPLHDVEMFDNGTSFCAFLKTVFYYHYYHNTAQFSTDFPTGLRDGSFFAWLSNRRDDCMLTNLEHEVLRFRRDVLARYASAWGFEYDGYRLWLHVYGRRELQLDVMLLHNTAVSMSTLRGSRCDTNEARDTEPNASPSRRELLSAKMPFASPTPSDGHAMSLRPSQAGVDATESLTAVDKALGEYRASLSVLAEKIYAGDEGHNAAQNTP